MEEYKQTNVVASILIMMCLMAIIFGFVMCSCTLSFQNVMTSGTASDVVDSDPKTDAKVDPTVNVPVKPL